MYLRTLGGLSLEGSDFTRPKPLLLVAYLTLEGPQHRREMAALFYPGAANPMRSLASEIDRLRRGAPGIIGTEGGRVWSEVDADAHALLASLDRGELDQGLDLYAGRFLDGVLLKGWSAGLEEWVYGTRELLGDHVRQALLTVAEREASEGGFRRGAESAERAYLLSGAPEPDPEDLVRLHRLLLAGESPEAAEVRKEAEGLSLDLVASIEGARSQLRTLAADVRAPHNLPASSTQFVGRRGEIARLSAQIAGAHGRLLTIVGPGGVGKTRLAIEVARASLPAFRDGAYFVPLIAVESPKLMIYAIADALGLRFFQQHDPQEQLLASLRERQLLLVLDNLEHLLEGVDLLSTMLEAAPGIRFLATSRERLDLLSEQVVDLRGLDFPTDEGADPGGFDAVALLVNSGRNHRSDFGLDADNSASVARICRLVEGHPLALELAASWLRVLTPADIAAEIEQGLDILQASARDLPERHRSLRATFDHSWRLLEDHERVVLRRLSVFRGGFRREAAREVAGASLLILAGLVDKSLLSLGSGGRYALHPLLHEFCQELLATEPEQRRSVEEAHGLYYLHFLRAQNSAMQDITGSRWRDVFELQSEELSNTQAAWRWAVAESRISELTGDYMLWTFTFINSLKEGLAFFEQAIAELNRDEPDHRTTLGKLLIGRAQVELWLSELESAHISVRQGLDLLGDRNDPQGVLQGLLVQGWTWWFGGEYAEARATFEAGLALARGGDDTSFSIYFLVGLGAVFQEVEDSTEIRAYHRHALDEVRAFGNAFNLGNYLLHLGMYLINTDRLEEARERLEEALGHARAMGDTLIQRFSLQYQGRLAWRDGSYELAHRLHRRVLAMAEEHGDRFSQAYMLANLSRSVLAEGDVDEALSLAMHSLELGRMVRSARVMLAALVSLAAVRMAQGVVAEAAGWLHSILANPATEQFYRAEAEQLLQSGRVPLAAGYDIRASGRARSRHLGLVVDEVLRELEAGGLDPRRSAPEEGREGR